MSGDRSWSTSGIDEKALAALAEELPASEVWTLLLEIVDRRAARRAPRDLRAQWAHDRSTQPAAMDPAPECRNQRGAVRGRNGLRGARALAAGAAGCLFAHGADPSQRRVVSALRGTEVVADPTNVLALECARRLKDDPARVVRLAASRRRRACAAGAERTRLRAALPAVLPGDRRPRTCRPWLRGGADVEHIHTHLAALDRLERNGYTVAEGRYGYSQPRSAPALPIVSPRDVRASPSSGTCSSIPTTMACVYNHRRPASPMAASRIPS